MEAHNLTVSETRPLGELFSALAQDTGLLVRKEVELVAVEMTSKAKAAGRDATIVVCGGAVLFLGAMALTAALVLGLAMVIPLWTAALVVGAVVSASGAGLALSGIRALKGIDVVPRQTIETLQENGQWLKNQASR